MLITRPTSRTSAGWTTRSWYCKQEWCACRDRSLGAELITAATMAPAMQPGTSQSAQHSQQKPAGKPQMAYATPSDNGKMRTAQGTAAVYFPVNKSEIDPSYMDNKAEMEKIRSTVSGVAGNADNKITSVHLMGYASPEGPYAKQRQVGGKPRCGCQELPCKQQAGRCVAHHGRLFACKLGCLEADAYRELY